MLRVFEEYEIRFIKHTEDIMPCSAQETKQRGSGQDGNAVNGDA
jgi:hypothetical protein